MVAICTVIDWYCHHNRFVSPALRFIVVTVRALVSLSEDMHCFATCGRRLASVARAVAPEQGPWESGLVVWESGLVGRETSIYVWDKGGLSDAVVVSCPCHPRRSTGIARRHWQHRGVSVFRCGCVRHGQCVRLRWRLHVCTGSTRRTRPVMDTPTPTHAIADPTHTITVPTHTIAVPTHNMCTCFHNYIHRFVRGDLFCFTMDDNLNSTACKVVILKTSQFDLDQ